MAMFTVIDAWTTTTHRNPTEFVKENEPPEAARSLRYRWFG